MAIFRYQSTDAQGRPVSGELEAASRDDAVARLAARGIAVRPGDLQEVPEAGPADAEPIPGAEPEGPEEAGAEGPEAVLGEVEAEGAEPAREPGPGRLSSAEAAEVVGHVADLAGAQLPLGPGLRAMAEELPDSWLAATLRQLASQIDSGTPLEDAVVALGERFPGHVRGMILAGVRTGRLAEVMEEFVDIQRGRRDAKRRIAMIMVYPGVLLLGLLGLLVFFSIFVVPQFREIFNDLGAELPGMTQFVLWVGESGVWFVVHGMVLLAVALYLTCTLRRPRWLRRVAYLIPLIGPILRASSLAEFSRLMRILLDQQMPLAESLWLVGDGLQDPALAVGCRRSAGEVERGLSLGESLAAYWQFPPTLLPLVRWGEQTSNLGEAFRAAGEMYEGRLRIRDTLLATITLPLALLVIACGVGFVLVSLFVPLVSVIQALSG